MKTTAVLFGIFGVTLCYPWGQSEQVRDTPEVAAARAAHLAAHAKAMYGAPEIWTAESRSWNDPEDDGSWTENKYDSNDGSWQGYNGNWQGNDGDDGSWRDDTHSWNQGSSSAHWKNHEKKWTGPIALPPGYDKNGAPLQVLDTPEVAAAKAAHLAALSALHY